MELCELLNHFHRIPLFPNPPTLLKALFGKTNIHSHRYSLRCPRTKHMSSYLHRSLSHTSKYHPATQPARWWSEVTELVRENTFDILCQEARIGSWIPCTDLEESLTEVTFTSRRPYKKSNELTFSTSGSRSHSLQVTMPSSLCDVAGMQWETQVKLLSPPQPQKLCTVITADSKFILNLQN